MSQSGHGHQGALNPVKVGMIVFLSSESAFFGTLIMTYLYMLGQGRFGSYTPGDILSLPTVLPGTVFLLSSSVTVHRATGRLHGQQEAGFRLWWIATMVLGALFLGGTALEWRDMIRNGFTINTNLFGSAYYTLVGFHAAHVTVGLLVLGLVLAMGRRTREVKKHEMFAEVVSWYWHFVDGVWVVVFTVVYVFGR